MALKKDANTHPTVQCINYTKNKYVMQLLINYEQCFFCIDESGYIVYNLIRKRKGNPSFTEASAADRAILFAVDAMQNNGIPRFVL